MHSRFTMLLIAASVLVVVVAPARTAANEAVQWLTEQRASLLDIGRVEANIALLRMERRNLPHWQNAKSAITRSEYQVARKRFVVEASLWVDEAAINEQTCLANLEAFRQAIVSFVTICPEPCANPDASAVSRLFHLEAFTPELRPRGLEAQLEATTRIVVALAATPYVPALICSSDIEGGHVEITPD